jgi:hypothetical protein
MPICPSAELTEALRAACACVPPAMAEMTPPENSSLMELSSCVGSLRRNAASPIVRLQLQAGAQTPGATSPWKSQERD